LRDLWLRVIIRLFIGICLLFWRILTLLIIVVMLSLLIVWNVRLRVIARRYYTWHIVGSLRVCLRLWRQIWIGLYNILGSRPLGRRLLRLRRFLYAFGILVGIFIFFITCNRAAHFR
jgi:hypothetical protein